MLCSNTEHATEIKRFLTLNSKKTLTATESRAALKLLDMQKDKMFMFTSCAWFFDDITDIQSMNAIKHALKAIETAQTFGSDFYNEFENNIAKAESNIKGINLRQIVKNIYLFKKPYLGLVLIGMSIGFFNQLTGINVIMYYATDIFRSAGFSTNSAIGQTVIIGFTNLVFTLLAMKLIDLIGRKKLLLIGSLGMAVFLGLFAWAYLTEQFEGTFLLFMLIGFIAFFAASQGAVIWVLLAEMFPNNIRGRGTSIGSFSHWFFNGVTSFLFPVVVGAFSNGKGVGYIFSFYAVVTFISYFVFKKYLTETKGKSLEELEKIMLHKD